MSEKEILKKWQEVYNLCLIKENNLRMKINDKNSNSIETRDELIKERLEIDKLRSEANKLMGAYYQLNFSSVIDNYKKQSSKR